MLRLWVVSGFVAYCTAVLAGCGNSRSVPVDPSVAATPGVIHSYAFPHSGVVFRAPADWTVNPGRAPLVAEVASGAATVAIWRYPRTEPLPASPAALALAKRRLIDAARARDRALRVLRATVSSVDGYPAIVLAASERVGSESRRVRSVHVFAHRAEIVVDAYAPPGMFHVVDHAVFSPLGHSLRLTPARA